ncbi:MAG: hypothetical protein K1X78_03010 [Verrucomicrobiaceae bacterium]|nr:hypothetical protein [Verrucomicrobiaceae bacterium]
MKTITAILGLLMAARDGSFGAVVHQAAADQASGEFFRAGDKQEVLRHGLCGEHCRMRGEGFEMGERHMAAASDDDGKDVLQAWASHANICRELLSVAENARLSPRSRAAVNVAQIRRFPEFLKFTAAVGLHRSRAPSRL